MYYEPELHRLLFERKANERGCVRAQTEHRRMERKGTQHHCRGVGATIAPGTGREWETGMTEKGDVQFYLLSSLP
jgi:hypothetical protein